jgi:hypothetical protein
LLSLLSILPDGLSDIELLQIKLPLQDVLTCKAVLLSTSLAYIDGMKRLKCLVPIREYMEAFHPAPKLLIQPLERHFSMLQNLYKLQERAGALHAPALQLRSRDITLFIKLSLSVCLKPYLHMVILRCPIKARAAQLLAASNRHVEFSYI